MSVTKFVCISLAILILVVLGLCLVVIIATETDAQDLPRPEVRIVNHWQRFADGENIGFAAYENEPDLVHGGPRVFGVVGIGLRNKTKTQWLEVMGGGLASRTGFDPAVDVRAQAKLLKLHSLTPWGECLHFFKSNRTLLSGAITQPISKKFGLRIESDTWVQASGNQSGIGPGISFAINKHVQLTSAYQFGIGRQRDVLRTYLAINW